MSVLVRFAGPCRVGEVTRLVGGPVGTIGVCGADFWGGFGLTAGGLDVIMPEGKGVYVDTAAGRVELDKAGLGTTVVNGAAQAPVAWGQDKIGRAVATITP